jgi:hypothetical protein
MLYAVSLHQVFGATTSDARPPPDRAGKPAGGRRPALASYGG